MNRKSNYFVLSLFVVYIIIAIIQISLDGLLPAWLYVSISFVSISISSCEVLKSILALIIKILKKQMATTNKFIDNISRNINIYSYYDKLKDEKEILCNSLEKIKDKNILAKNNKKIALYEKMIHLIEFFEILSSTIMLFITPLKLIQYDNITNRINSILALFSFAFIFLSLYINNVAADIDAFGEADLYFEKTDYNMEILKKISGDRK